MKYKLEIDSADLAYIGSLLDKQPHIEVAKIVAAIQTQINEQEVAEKQRSNAAWEKARQDWFDSETERRKHEAAADQPEQGE